MAIAETPTLLSLDRYAKVMGINPAHFNRASADNVMPIGFGGSGASRNACADLWPRYSWQYSDHVSWEDLAREINTAEEDIARTTGYYPAPKWIAQEVHRYPRHYRRDVWRRQGRNLRGARASIKLNYDKFIQAGRRATTAIADATVVGGTLVYDTTALTATVTAATTLTDECEVRVYQNGETSPEYEIRPARSKSISGGTFTAVFDIWLFILPSLWNAYPDTQVEFGAIDVTDVSNLLTEVDVLREYTDFTQASAVFYWEPDPENLEQFVFCGSCGSEGCAACSLSTQNGCIHTRDTELGFVVPVPATYDATTEQWDQVALDQCRDPDEVKVYYYAGEYSNRWLSGQTCDPMSNFWAQTVAMLATARLERPFCSCGNVRALEEKYKKDLAVTTPESFQVTLEDLANPFGTRFGEVMAWKRISKVVPQRLGGGAI